MPSMLRLGRERDKDDDRSCAVTFEPATLRSSREP
jgi:hypothetical protein